MTVTKGKERNWQAEVDRARIELDEAKRLLERAKRYHGQMWSHYNWLVAEQERATKGKSSDRAT